MRLLPTQPRRPERRESNSRSVLRSCRLSLRPRAFLNQLLHFNQPRLVVRGAGLTLCRATEFGVFFPDNDRYVDPVSGFEVAPEEVAGIYFHRGPASPPSFEIDFYQEGFACSVYPGRSGRCRETIGSIVKSFAEQPISSRALRDAGAIRWLDEVREAAPGESISLHNPGEKAATEVLIRSAGFGFEGTFAPDRRDDLGSLVRLSDRAGHSVVFAERRHVSGQFGNRDSWPT